MMHGEHGGDGILGPVRTRVVVVDTCEHCSAIGARETTQAKSEMQRTNCGDELHCHCHRRFPSRRSG